MSHPAPDSRKVERLERLRALARLKADAELARLATVAQGRARLMAALAALGSAEPPLGPVSGDAPATQPGAIGGSRPPQDDAASMAGAAHSALARVEGHSDAPAPACPVPGAALPVDPMLVRARLAHGQWITAQRSALNARLAMIQADWLRLQPGAARALGRAEVLKTLCTQARTARATARHRNDD